MSTTTTTTTTTTTATALTAAYNEVSKAKKALEAALQAEAKGDGVLEVKGNGVIEVKRNGVLEVKGLGFTLPFTPELRRTAEPLRPYHENGGGAASWHWSRTSVFDEAGNCLDKHFKGGTCSWSHEACAGLSEASAHRDYEEAELLTGPEPVIAIGAWSSSPGGEGAVVEVHDSIEIPEWVDYLVSVPSVASEAADAVADAKEDLASAEARLAEEKAKAATRAYKQARSAAAEEARRLQRATKARQKAEAAARRRLGFA